MMIIHPEKQDVEEEQLLIQMMATGTYFNIAKMQCNIEVPDHSARKDIVPANHPTNQQGEKGKRKPQVVGPHYCFVQDHGKAIDVSKRCVAYMQPFFAPDYVADEQQLDGTPNQGEVDGAYEEL